MKSLKIVFASLFLTAGIITLSSFVANYNSDAFAIECYEYTTGQGVNDPQDVRTASNWTTIGQGSVAAACPETPFLCAICFEGTQSQFPAGSTLAQRKAIIVDALADWLELGNELSDLTTDPAAVSQNGYSFTVYKRNVE